MDGKMNSLTPQDFVAKWKRVTSRERQAVQEHFIDLCHIVGHQTPNDYDPTGTRFAFEMGAGKTSGGQGWADAAKIGYFGWEYKGKDHDLDKAYAQLLLYRDALQNPPVLVVSDINNIIIRTNYTYLPTRTITLTLDDMLKPESLKVLRAVFFNPEELKPAVTIAGVTEEAARHFSKLADILRKYGESPQSIAHFLIRLLFCLFAEDIGLLPEKLFPRLLDQTRRNAKDFAGVLRQLFVAMKSGGYFGPERIMHFNGGLFDDDQVLELDGDAMDIIANIDALDWAQMEPSIFGTLFVRGLDPSKRSQLGAHYTGKDDILLIVEPVLMAPLRREWEALKSECRMRKLELKNQSEKKQAQGTERIGVRLRAFADQIASIRVLDAACGSGNFLYVALQLLLDLQNEVISFSDEMGAGRFFISVSPAQLYGIELNEYAHELAQVTIWIGYIQWLVKNGYGLPSEPILKTMDNIKHMDAILVLNDDHLPEEPQWPAAEVIVGNPPFLGDKKMRSELGHHYVEALRKLYEHRIPGQSDLVCYWFEKARAMIENGQVKRAGLLATQGIRGGANRTVLERIKQSGDIFWAYSDREWILDGATVHVSMIGFDNGFEKNRELNGKLALTINSDLSNTANIASAFPLRENSSLSFIGTQKTGAFDLTSEQAKIMISSANPNGRSSREIIKPWINALDIVREPRKMWIIDFGTNMTLEEAAQYEMPFEYIKKHVKPFRDTVRRKNHREKWWLFGETRTGMRQAIYSLPRFIVTPMVSKYRIFAWVNAGTIPENLLVVIARSDDYFFGMLHSSIHEAWSRQLGTQLREAESGQRYTPTSTFETFPFPWPPGHEPQDDLRVHAIAQAAKELVEMRDRWLNAEGLPEAERKKRTLTNLYNARPTWLDLAHKKLDAAVFAAYGWPHDLSDEQILERLLALNLARAGKQ
jgi:type II restriction/modification system DNA methylase subunit YeeA